MAIADHGVSDRAISAPDDSVVVIVSAAGRCLVRDRPINACELADILGAGCFVYDGPAVTVTAGDLPAGLVGIFDADAGSVTLENFPP